MKKHLLLLFTVTAFFLAACGRTTAETKASEEKPTVIEKESSSEVSETLPEETSKSFPIKDSNNQETETSSKDTTADPDESAAEDTSSSETSSSASSNGSSTVEGGYVITKGDASAAIIPPANWLIEKNSKDMLTICDSVDYQTLITFYMYNNTSSDTLAAYMESDIIPFYQNNNSYIEHGYADDSLYADCIWISCQDGSTVYYAWMEVNGSNQVVMEIDDYSGQDMYELIPQILSMIDVYEN